MSEVRPVAWSFDGRFCSTVIRPGPVSDGSEWTVTLEWAPFDRLLRNRWPGIPEAPGQFTFRCSLEEAFDRVKVLVGSADAYYQQAERLEQSRKALKSLSDHDYAAAG